MPWTAFSFAACLFAGTAGALAEPGDDFSRNLSLQQKEVVGAVTARPGDLVISAEFDRRDGIYAKGEAVRIAVNSNRDAYVAIVTTGPGGDVAVLYANAVQPAVKIPADTRLVVPPPGSPLEIAVSAPYGVELVTFIVSDQPLKLFEPSDLTPSGNVASVKGGAATFRTRAEALAREHPEFRP